MSVEILSDKYPGSDIGPSEETRKTISYYGNKCIIPEVGDLMTDADIMTGWNVVTRVDPSGKSFWMRKLKIDPKHYSPMTQGHITVPRADCYIIGDEVQVKTTYTKKYTADWFSGKRDYYRRFHNNVSEFIDTYPR